MLNACYTLPSVNERQTQIEQLAIKNGWHKEFIETSLFDFVSYVPNIKQIKEPLTIYIEGDGLAWLSVRKPSENPTPINPIGFKLALKIPNNNAVYLARPCQYLTDIRCEMKYWTSHRFSKEVIDASNEAVDKLKQLFSAKQLILVGYSGGGAITALLAAERDDVIKLITVAGNLDHEAWTSFHHITPLFGSLNPADYPEHLSKVKQVHFVGEDDIVIPPFLAYDFVGALPTPSDAKVIRVDSQSHGCCWEVIWDSLMQKMDALNY